MKLPKQVKRLCTHCKKHTQQVVKQDKNRGRSKAHPMSAAAKSRYTARGLGTGAGNHGKYGSKPALAKWKRTGKKLSKKTDLRYTCSECKKISVQASVFRAKKVEII